ncbi:hypothetical protein E2562_033032 [Oryza meyeriana var. granulata]|uniref:Uncharacterized protein n=1 Tax=Oryza meyeriana var. granulata TaxID=110450 RepID=A0A6G1CUX6_9ORYZ|nr:hypothetical protein E2562_033032 [Oryza meyeriana var. granulata]
MSSPAGKWGEKGGGMGGERTAFVDSRGRGKGTRGFGIERRGEAAFLRSSRLEVEDDTDRWALTPPVSDAEEGK